MPITINHVLSATTPDNTSAEIRPSHWNSAHQVSLSLGAGEVIKYIGAGTSLQSSGTISFSNANGVSFGMAGGTITGSINALTSQSVQTQGIQSISAGGNSVGGGQVIFSNANGLAFGLAGSTITGSYTVPTQTAQSMGIYASSQTTGASSSSTVDARSLSFVGAGGVSVGLTGGSVVISGATGGGGGVNSFNILAAGSQTGGTATTVQFANSNGITFGMSGSAQITASHNALTSQSNQAVSAANGSSTFQTLSFGNSNGVSWSVSNGSVVASVVAANATLTGYATGNTTQGSSGTVNAQSLLVNAYGIVSAGVSNGSLIISAPDAASYTELSVGFSTGGNTAGNTGMVVSQMVLAGGNNITLSGSTNGQSLTISIVGGAGGGGGTITGYAGSNTVGQSSSTTFNINSLPVAGYGIASVGYSAGSLIVSVPSGGGVGDGGNVIVAGTQTATSLGSVSFADSNGISFGLAGSTRLTASHNGLTTAAQSNHSHGNPTLALTNLTGTTASASNGLTLSLSAAAVLTAMSLYAVSNTTQSSSATGALSALSFAGAGAVSVGASNGSIIISAAAGAQSVQSIGVYGVSNTTGASSSSTVDARSLSFQGAGGVSVGLTNGSVVISGGAGAAPAASAANGSFSFATLSFSNLNGISFGTSAGSAITASHNGLTTAAASNHSHGNPTLALTNLSGTTASASNGLTLSLSAGAQTAQTIGVYASSQTTGQSSSSTIDARSVTYRGAGIVSVGISGGEVIISATAGGAGDGGVFLSAAGSSQSAGNILFSNSNGVSFGMNGSTVTASHNGLTTAAASNHSHGNPTLALTNLTGTTASASNGLTISLSANAPSAATLTVSAVGNTTVNSSGTWPNAISIRGYGVLSVGTSNGSLLLSTPDPVDFTQLSVGVSSGGNTAGDTGLFTGRLVLAGGANITLSGSSNGGSVTVSVVGGAGGGGVAISGGTQLATSGSVFFSNSNNLSFGLSGSTRMTMSGALNLYGLGNTTQNSSTVLGLAAISLNGLGAMTVGYSNGSVQLSAPAVSSLSATGQVSISVNGSTISIGVPNAGTDTNGYNPYADQQLQITQVGQASLLLDPQAFGNIAFDRIAFPIFNTNSSNSSGSHSLSFYFGLYSRNASTLSLVFSASRSTAVTHSGTAGSYSLYSGLRLFTMGATQTVTAGKYWMGFASSTSSGGTNGSYSNLAVNNGFYSNTAASATYSYGAVFGQAVNATNQVTLGQGYYTAATAGMPSSIAFSQINGTASNAGNQQAILFASSTV